MFILSAVEARKREKVGKKKYMEYFKMHKLHKKLKIKHRGSVNKGKC